MSLLEVKGLSLGFAQKQVIQNLSFNLDKGDYLHIIGRNGAGKTSFLKSLLAILPVGSGQIILAGKPITEYSSRELAQKIAYLPQVSSSAPFTVAELLSLGTYAREKDFIALHKLYADPYAQKIIELTEISGLLDQPLNTLSGGERQRAYLASALLQKPEILLLDEASNFLDSWYSKSLNALLLKINQEEKLTIISVSHDLEQVRQANSKLLILEEESTKFYAQNTAKEVQAWQAQTKKPEKLKIIAPKSHLPLKFSLLTLATFLVLAVNLFLALNPEDLSLAWVNPWLNSEEMHILMHIRLPRVLAAFSVGLGLSLAGMAFQALFRNPLASPYTLGISSASALAVALTILLPFSLTSSFWFFKLGILPAFLGAGLLMLVIWRISRANFHNSSASLLLAGVAANFFFSSLLMLIQYLADLSSNFKITRMLMGSLDNLGLEYALILTLLVLLSSLPFVFMSKELDLLLLGEEEAQAKGANLKQIRMFIFVFSSLLVASVVAFCGPIGFVGMMCPHICRLVFGQRHSLLAPSSALFGALFLGLCDLLARTLIAPAEIPVGVITSVLGAPLFFYLLVRQSRVKN